MDIERLINNLFIATYRDDSCKRDFPIIYGDNKKAIIEKIVCEWANSQNDITQVNDLKTNIAVMEAKIFAYEAFISNSNFKPILLIEKVDS